MPFPDKPYMLLHQLFTLAPALLTLDILRMIANARVLVYTWQGIPVCTSCMHCMPSTSLQADMACTKHVCELFLPQTTAISAWLHIRMLKTAGLGAAPRKAVVKLGQPLQLCSST